jgi:DNA-directed RNA polymerase subunit RPC12/RpoP
MPEFKYPCPRCGQNIQCDTGYAGTQINCPACQQPIVVPQATAVPPPPPRPAAPAMGRKFSGPPAAAKTRQSRNVLVIVATLVVLAGLAVGGWFVYSKIKYHKFVEEGLVAYYPLNGNANDASGNGNGGRVVGAKPCNDRFGKANGAFRFNGVGNYISFKSVPLKKLDNWSLSAWINPASLDEYGMVVCLGFDDGKTGDGFAFGMTMDSLNKGNHLTGVLGGVKWVPSGYSFPSPSAWYHVVMLRNDGVTKYYVNGIQTANTESSTPHAPTAFTIGSATHGRFFNGMIDDVRIYNHALSPEEIRAIYAGQK